MVDLPIPTIETLAAVVVAFLAGASCPVYYANERFRGFGRAMMSKLPYEPPPGQDEQQALEDAVDDDAAR
jgi:hypothetical protein